MIQSDCQPLLADTKIFPICVTRVDHNTTLYEKNIFFHRILSVFELQAYFEFIAGTCTVLLLLKMFNDLKMLNIDALQGNDDSHMGPPSYYQ